MSGSMLGTVPARHHPLVGIAGLTLLGSVLLFAYSRLTYFLPVSLTGVMLDAARHLAHGDGLVTNAVTLGFLAAYKSAVPPVPYLWYPLVPVTTAGLFAVFGVKPWLVLVPPVVSYFGSAILLYAFGRSLFGPVTALGAAALLMMQPILIDTTVGSNFSDPVLLALLIACVLCVFRAGRSPQRSYTWLIATGGVLGLAQYARSAGMMLYLPMAYLVFATFVTHRGRRLAAFFVPCFAVQIPFLAFNKWATGSLTFTPTYLVLFMTKSFPAFSANRVVLPASLMEILTSYGRDVAHKWITQLWVHYKYLLTMTNPIVVVAAILMAFTATGSEEKRLRNFVVVFYVCLAVLNSLVIWDNRYLLPVVPFVALMGIEFVRRTVSRLTTRRVIRVVATTVLVVLVATETIDFYYQAVKRVGEQRLKRDEKLAFARFIRDNVGAADTVMTTDIGLAAWASGRPAVGIARDPDAAALVHHTYVPFNTLVLPTRIEQESLYGFSPDWRDVAAGRQPFLDFRRQAETRLPSGEGLVLLRQAPAGSR